MKSITIMMYAATLLLIGCNGPSGGMGGQGIEGSTSAVSGQQSETGGNTYNIMVINNGSPESDRVATAIEDPAGVRLTDLIGMAKKTDGDTRAIQLPGVVGMHVNIGTGNIGSTSTDPDVDDGGTLANPTYSGGSPTPQPEPAGSPSQNGSASQPAKP